LPWEIFADLLQRVLRPKATVRRHPDAFWRGWRLVALDGTQFSLTNTPQVHATKRKARTRRGRAAFAKITAAVLLELSLHNPLAAAVGGDDESGPRRPQRATNQPHRAAWIRSDAPLRHAKTPRSVMSARSAPSGDQVAATDETQLDRRAAGVHHPMMPTSAISGRH
jgi:hypothetical protein